MAQGPQTTDVEHDRHQHIARATTCKGCNQVRQVYRWLGGNYGPWPYARFALCAPCLLAALTELLGKSLHRR